MGEKYTEYNFREAFETDGINEHIHAIESYCKINKIPFFASFAIANEKGTTSYDNYSVSAALEDVKLYDDRIKDHVLIYRGFRIAPIGEVGIGHDEDIDAYLNDDDFDLNDQDS